MRMKKIVTLLIACIMLAALTAGVFAETSKLDYVTDAYGLFTRSELSDLETRAAAISDEYSCGIYVVIVDDFKNYSHRTDAYGAACDIYESYNLGYGDTRNGYLLLLSIDERDYALTAYDDARSVFTDSAFYSAEQAMLARLKENDWKGGVEAFINGCEKLLKSSGGMHEYNGTSEGYYEDKGAVPYLIIVGVSALIALVVCLIFNAQMKTAKESTTADEYIKTSSIVFNVKQDQFTHRTVTRTKINTDNGSRGGGGGGGGHSGHSGKF